MGEQASEETKVSDAEKLYRLWVKYEYEVVKKKRRPNPSASALKLFNKALTKRTRLAIELYLNHFYTSPDQWTSYMRVNGYTKPENLFRKQNLESRVDEAVARYIYDANIPEYAYKEVEWTEYRGRQAYVGDDGSTKVVFGGEKEIQKWMSLAKELGIKK